MMLQVERALMLRFEGFVTCESAAAFKAKTRSSPIIKTLNTVSGKESTRLNNFNHTNWGDEANGYLLSIKNSLSDDKKFDRVVNQAMRIAMANRKKDFVASAAVNEDANERALLADDSDDDSGANN
jgi:hypothetical protein